MLNSGTLVVVRCRISRGGFSSERVFRINLSGGGEHVGAAPVEYCFDENQKRLPPDQPARGVTIAGFVAARVVEPENDTILVSVPSGDVLRIHTTEITEHPKGMRAHVPVQS